MYQGATDIDIIVMECILDKNGSLQTCPYVLCLSYVRQLCSAYTKTHGKTGSILKNSNLERGLKYMPSEISSKNFKILS